MTDDTAEVNELLGRGTLDRVRDIADSFGDDKDRILEAVDWVWDHRDELIDLTAGRELPEPKSKPRSKSPGCSATTEESPCA